MDDHAPCPFCRELTAAQTGAAGHALAAIIPDANPVTEGHLLAVPRRHVERIEELSSIEWGALFDMTRARMRALREEPGVDGVNLGVNSGVAAGQTVPHAHVHLIPRRHGDCDDPRGGVRWILARSADYWGHVGG